MRLQHLRGAVELRALLVGLGREEFEADGGHRWVPAGGYGGHYTFIAMKRYIDDDLAGAPPTGVGREDGSQAISAAARMSCRHPASVPAVGGSTEAASLASCVRTPRVVIGNARLRGC